MVGVGRPPSHSTEQGTTTVKKNYQTKTASAVTTGEIVLPDEVSVAMAELDGAMKEGLLAMAVGAGFQVMAVMMEDNVTTCPGACARTART